MILAGSVNTNHNRDDAQLRYSWAMHLLWIASSEAPTTPTPHRPMPTSLSQAVLHLASRGFTTRKCHWFQPCPRLAMSGGARLPSDRGGPSRGHISSRWRDGGVRTLAKFLLRLDRRTCGVRFPALAGEFQNGPKSPPNGPKTTGPT
jgi:hypothetical protein